MLNKILLFVIIISFNTVLKWFLGQVLLNICTALYSWNYRNYYLVTSYCHWNNALNNIFTKTELNSNDYSLWTKTTK